MSLRSINAAAMQTERLGIWSRYARALIGAKGNLPLAAEMAERARAHPDVVAMVKSAAAIGSTTDAAWAEGLAQYRFASDAFVESLRSVSIFDTLYESGMVKVPLHSKLVSVTTALTGGGPGETMVTPLGQMAFTAPTIAARRAIGEVAISDQIARFMEPETVNFFNEELKKAAVKAIDAIFLPALIAAVTPTASAGSSFTNIMSDVSTLLAAIASGPASRFFLIVGTANCKKLAAKTDASGAVAFPGMGPTGGTICGITVMASAEIGSTSAILVDPSGLVGASGLVFLDASNAASLQMETAPDSPTTASTTTISLWQQGLRAIRAEREFGFSVARSSCIAALSGVSY